MEDVGIFYVHLVNFRPFCIPYGHLVYFPSFGTFLPVLVCCTKKNLATLISRCKLTFLPFRLEIFATKLIKQQKNASNLPTSRKTKKSSKKKVFRLFSSERKQQLTGFAVVILPRREESKFPIFRFSK
jgi:hypothetical protein